MMGLQPVCLDSTAHTLASGILNVCLDQVGQLGFCSDIDYLSIARRGHYNCSHYVYWRRCDYNYELRSGYWHNLNYQLC